MNISFTATDIQALLPLLILVAGSSLILLLTALSFTYTKRWGLILTTLTIVAALGACALAPVSTHPLLVRWLKFDHLSTFFTLLFLSIGLACVLLSESFFKSFMAPRGEYYFLILCCLFGLLLIGSSADFLTLFIGIETLSISLYVLCGYMKKWEFSAEGAMKYFFMGSLASAILLYGIALMYGATATTSFDALMPIYHTLEGANKTLFWAGCAMITAALAFKAAIVPFHFWAPDVYDGSPTPVTAFMAVGTKVGAFAALTRIFMQALPHFDPLLQQGIVYLIYPTLILANFAAMKQTRLRRFFAYSGISHAGFLLIPFAAGGSLAEKALYFYLVVYAVATLGAFTIMAILDKTSDGLCMDDLKGLYSRSPFLAAILILSLLTLAGIPPTVGFFAKLYILKAAIAAGLYMLSVTALAASVLAAYYYLKIVALVLTDAEVQEPLPKRPFASAGIAVVALIALVLLSCFPAVNTLFF